MVHERSDARANTSWVEREREGLSAAGGYLGIFAVGYVHIPDTLPHRGNGGIHFRFRRYRQLRQHHPRCHRRGVRCGPRRHGSTLLEPPRAWRPTRPHIPMTPPCGTIAALYYVPATIHGCMSCDDIFCTTTVAMQGGRRAIVGVIPSTNFRNEFISRRHFFFLDRVWNAACFPV